MHKGHTRWSSGHDFTMAAFYFINYGMNMQLRLGRFYLNTPIN